MKKYSNVMNTNVTWIPQIPAHWKLQKINALFTERKKRFQIRIISRYQ